ncbi:MAG: hypothetical protein Q9160_001583 [Pyrenula sp. 1 TL-2023]
MYNRLVEIKTHLEDLREPYLDSLSEVKVQLSRLEIHGDNGIDFEERFCQPIPANDFEDLYTSLANEEESCLKERRAQGSMDRFDQAQDNIAFLRRVVAGIEHQGDLYGNSHWIGRIAYNTYPQLSSGDYKEPVSQQWEMGFIRHALPLPRRWSKTHSQKAKSRPRVARSFAGREVIDLPRTGAAQPHVACSVANGSPADDQKLFRAEILAAVSILASHFQHKAIWRNYYVFVYSFAGPYVRILQIHLDATSSALFVRMSPFVAIDCHTPEEEWEDKVCWQDNEDKIKLLLRWMAGTPIGDTTYKSLDPAEDDESHTAEQPRTPSKRSLRVAE